jgi:hypothetical protein
MVHIQQDNLQTPFLSEGLCHNSDGYLPAHRAVSRLRLQVRSCGICGESNGTGACFIRAFRLSLPIIVPPTAQQSSYHRQYIFSIPTAFLTKQIKKNRSDGLIHLWSESTIGLLTWVSWYKLPHYNHISVTSIPFIIRAYRTTSLSS